MELTRKQVIEHLVMMKSYAIGENYEALEYAINSLKTDENYQLMYEGGEIYTKADMLAMLTELKMEIYKKQVKATDSLDKGINIGIGWIAYMVQEKIDKLKGEQDG